MSKEKLAAAKQFIREKQYQEARLILESTDHPKATEWLAKLPKPTKPEKLKNAPSSSMKTPAIMIGGLALLLLTFIAGFIIGQAMISFAPERPLTLTRTAISNANSTTAALIFSTQTTAAEATNIVNMTATTVCDVLATHATQSAAQNNNPINMTRTAIHNANSTTEALIIATQTAATSVEERASIATFTWTPDPALPTWTPTPE